MKHCETKTLLQRLVLLGLCAYAGGLSGAASSSSGPDFGLDFSGPVADVSLGSKRFLNLSREEIIAQAEKLAFSIDELVDVEGAEGCTMLGWCLAKFA